MIVATRAGHGQPHHPARGDINLISDQEMTLPALISPTHRQKTQSRLILKRSIHQIRSHLQMHKAIIGQVFIKGSNDPITVGVGVRVIFIIRHGCTLGVGIARDIEPVPRPTFAESLPRQRRFRRGLGPFDSGPLVGHPLLSLGSVGKEPRCDMPKTTQARGA